MSRTLKRPYTGSKRIDKSCRSHGDCPWCTGNRQCKHQRREDAADESLADWVTIPEEDV